MDVEESLTHSAVTCKHHVLSIWRYWRIDLYGETPRELGNVFRARARLKESHVEKAHLMPAHMHMLISNPQEHSVAQVIVHVALASSRRFASS